MTQVISVRVPPAKLAALDKKAAQLGVDRSKYILRLLDQDLSRPESGMKRRFASSHLLGKFISGGSSNQQVRAALKK